MDTFVWVDLETTKACDGIWTLKGRILKDVFDAVVSNQLSKGFIKVDQVYWTQSTYDSNGEKSGEELCEYGGIGKRQAYMGEMYLRVEDIVSLSPIDAKADKARFKTREERKLAVVSPIKP